MQHADADIQSTSGRKEVRLQKSRAAYKSDSAREEECRTRTVFRGLQSLGLQPLDPLSWAFAQLSNNQPSFTGIQVPHVSTCCMETCPLLEPSSC